MDIHYNETLDRFVMYDYVSDINMHWDGEGFYLGQDQPNMMIDDDWRQMSHRRFCPADDNQRETQRLTDEEMQQAKG